MSDNSFFISAEAEELADGLIRIDVKTVNVPDDLFGVSFHLRIDGGKWGLVNFRDGDVFAGAEPVFLAREKNTESHKIVAGMSLKSGDDVRAKDGVLMTFFVRPAENSRYTLSFENTVASVFENGRKDLTNVFWEGSEVYVSEVSPDLNDAVFDNIENGQIHAEVMHLGLSDYRADLLNGDAALTAREEGFDIYVPIVAAVLVMLAGYLFFLRFIKGGLKS